MQWNSRVTQVRLLAWLLKYHNALTFAYDASNITQVGLPLSSTAWEKMIELLSNSALKLAF